MTHSWKAYAEHVLEATARIRRIASRGDVVKDDVLYDATLRNLQTLCEATQRLPDALKSGHPEIPWHEIGGLRNILVHNYLGKIDAETVAGIIANDLPQLEQVVRRMLESED